MQVLFNLQHCDGLGPRRATSLLSLPEEAVYGKDEEEELLCKAPMASARAFVTEKHRRLWQDLFSNPWQWRDNRAGKRSPNFPDFIHRISGEALWLDNPVKPLWVDWKVCFLDKWFLPQNQVLTEEGNAYTEQIQRLCEVGHLNRALVLLHSQSATPPLDNHGYISLLKVCSIFKSSSYVRYVHAHIVMQDLNISGLLGDTLVSALAKCGALDDARHVLFSLGHRTVNTWTCMIAAYSAFDKPLEALEMHRSMQEDGVEPNQYTYVNLLKACANIANLAEAEKLHAAAERNGFISNVFVGNTLVSMYGKCGNIAKAERVFDALPKADVVSWTALLLAYLYQDYAEDALQLYRQMQEEGVNPDSQAIAIALHACSRLVNKDDDGSEGNLVSLFIGRALHIDAAKNGLTSDAYINNTLIYLYGKCGNIAEAESVFNQIGGSDVISWNSMLSAFVEQGQEDKALQLYRQMLEVDVAPDQHTCVIILNACYSLELKHEIEFGKPEETQKLFFEIGQSVHVIDLRKKFISNPFIRNALISLYGRCRSIAEAENVFDGLWKRDIVSWSALLTAYVEDNEGEKALKLFWQMQEEGISPDKQAFTLALQACVVIADEEFAFVEELHSNKLIFLEIGFALHVDAWKTNDYKEDAFVGTSLMTMYGKYGRIMDAEDVFFGTSWRETVAWNTILSAYMDLNRSEEVLHLFKEMEKAGVPIDDTTVLCVLEACRDIGWMEICKQVHFTIVFAGYDFDYFIGNTLIRVYGTCASMADAWEVFDALPQYHLVSWNSCTSAHAQEGNHTVVLQLFNEMQSVGIVPDAVTFVSLLSVCSHGGLLQVGSDIFQLMTKDYDIKPDIKHYLTMVDLFGRAGEFIEVESVLAEIPFHIDSAFWLCLLSACCSHCNVQLGMQAFECAVYLNPEDPAAYVLMSNIFIDAGLKEHASEIEKLRQTEELGMDPAGVSVEK